MSPLPKIELRLKQQFQFIGMNFQMNDVYLDAYNNMFKTSIIKSLPRV